MGQMLADYMVNFTTKKQTKKHYTRIDNYQQAYVVIIVLPDIVEIIPKEIVFFGNKLTTLGSTL